MKTFKSKHPRKGYSITVEYDNNLLVGDVFDSERADCFEDLTKEDFSKLQEEANKQT